MTPAEQTTEATPMIVESGRLATANGDSRRAFFVVPTYQQLLGHLDVLCPVCQHNKPVALRMLREMQAHLAYQRHGFTGPTQEPEVDRQPTQQPEHDPAPEGVIAKGVSYAKAKLGPAADEATVERRLDMCNHGGVYCPNCTSFADYDPATDEWFCSSRNGGNACDWRSARAVESAKETTWPCPKRIGKDEKTYCGACNCSAWKDAELKKKATMQNATCLRRLWPTQINGSSDNG